jgi:hypothetical protein
MLLSFCVLADRKLGIFLFAYKLLKLGLCFLCTGCLEIMHLPFGGWMIGNFVSTIYMALTQHD